MVTKSRLTTDVDDVRRYTTKNHHCTDILYCGDIEIFSSNTVHLKNKINKKKFIMNIARVYKDVNVNQ